jgi:hypothetical protein
MSCAAFLAFYRLDAKTCRRMQEELELRRAREAAEGENDHRGKAQASNQQGETA